MSLRAALSSGLAALAEKAESDAFDEHLVLETPLVVDVSDPVALAREVFSFVAPKNDARAFFFDIERGDLHASVGVTLRLPVGHGGALPKDTLAYRATRSPRSRLVGAFRFDAHAPTLAPEWEAFGTGYLIAPRLAVEVQEGRLTLSVRREPDETFDVALVRARRIIDDDSTSPEARAPSALHGGASTPDAAGYRENVEAALAAFASGTLSKVVLARRLAFDDVERALPERAVAGLLDSAQGFAFFIAPEPDVAFFGLSPELLYRRRGHTLETEALAGTRPRGESDEADRTLAVELYESDKDRREHLAVKDHVMSALAPLAERLDASASPSLRKLPHVQHLCTPISASLRADDDDALLAALHPTPAVCGTPRERARAFIAAHEGFDRGLYAGPVGLLGEGGATFSVALRCGLFSSGKLYLYAGAGLVEGSSPDLEWAEVETKTRVLKDRLEGAP